MAAEQVIDHRRRAFVRDDGDVEGSVRLEQFGAHIAAGAERRRADVELARLRFGEGNDVGDGFARERRIGDQRHRHRGDQAGGREVLARIVAGVNVKAGIDRNGAGMAEQQRVAVGRGMDDRAAADGAAGAGLVVHDHLLMKRIR